MRRSRSCAWRSATRTARRNGAKVKGTTRSRTAPSGSSAASVARWPRRRCARRNRAAHGTAPSLRGKNVANPMAMILAGAALLANGGVEAQQAGRAIREACLEAVAAGTRTADLGGHAGTTEFTDEVIRRVKSKLEVWATL